LYHGGSGRKRKDSIVRNQTLGQKNGGCCGPLVLLILVVVVLFSIVFVAPQTPTGKPVPQWYQIIENVVGQSGQQVQHTFDTMTGKRAVRASAKTSYPSAPSGSCFDLARAAAVQAGIDPTLYVRQINQESGCQSALR
jgi:hypothetical protein